MSTISNKIDELERKVANDKNRGIILDQMISLLQQGKVDSPEYAFAKMRLASLGGHKATKKSCCKVIAMSF